jgi:hypothetical protein
MMGAESKVNVNWSYNVKILKGSCHKYNLNKDLVKVLQMRFTKATITSTSGERIQFYAHPCFQGHQWYDWELVHFQDINNQGDHRENHCPSKILGFISIEGERKAVIQCSVKPLLWTTVERFIFVKLKLGIVFNISFVTVPIEALVHLLCVIPYCRGVGDQISQSHQTCSWDSSLAYYSHTNFQ